MAPYLNEDMFGRDPQKIGFPNLLLCIGIVVVTDDDLYGFHSSSLSSDQTSLTAFKDFCQQRGLGSVRSVFSAANFESRRSSSDVSWEDEMRVLCAQFDYSGEVYGFDTGIGHPTGGMYVQFVKSSAAVGGCEVSFKRGEKTISRDVIGTPNSDSASIVAYDIRSHRPRPTAYTATSVVGRTSLFHTGVFHVADSSTLTRLRV